MKRLILSCSVLLFLFTSADTVKCLDDADSSVNLENEVYQTGFTVLTQMLDKIELLSQPVRLIGTNPKIILGHTRFVWSVAFSSDSHLLASGSWDKTVRLWSADTGELPDIFIGHENDITTVAFSPDNQILASGGWDRTVRLWDIETGEEKKSPAIGMQFHQ